MSNLLEIIHETLHSWETWVGFETNRHTVSVSKPTGHTVSWKSNTFINYVHTMLAVNRIWYFRINNQTEKVKWSYDRETSRECCINLRVQSCIKLFNGACVLFYFIIYKNRTLNQPSYIIWYDDMINKHTLKNSLNSEHAIAFCYR